MSELRKDELYPRDWARFTRGGQIREGEVYRVSEESVIIKEWYADWRRFKMRKVSRDKVTLHPEGRPHG